MIANDRYQEYFVFSWDEKTRLNEIMTFAARASARIKEVVQDELSRAGCASEKEADRYLRWVPVTRQIQRIGADFDQLATSLREVKDLPRPRISVAQSPFTNNALPNLDLLLLEAGHCFALKPYTGLTDIFAETHSLFNPDGRITQSLVQANEAYGVSQAPEVITARQRLYAVRQAAVWLHDQAAQENAHFVASAAKRAIGKLDTLLGAELPRRERQPRFDIDFFAGAPTLITLYDTWRCNNAIQELISAARGYTGALSEAKTALEGKWGNPVHRTNANLFRVALEEGRAHRYTDRQPRGALAF